MTELIHLSLIAYIPLTLILFMMFSARRAVLVSYIGAWLFLPQAVIDFSGFPDLSKVSAASTGVLLGVLCFDASRLMRIKWHWMDLPVIVFCLAPMGSSLSNGLGLYDGFSAVLNQLFIWGIPYLAGRMYLTDFIALREAAIALFIGALLYVPLCHFEMRFSPQLHRMVYGFHPHEFAQTMRGGNFRPVVFMQHGLMVAMWMAVGSIIGFWLWHTGSLRRLLGMPAWLLVAAQVMTTVMTRSMGAVALMGAGMALLTVNTKLRSRVLIVVFASIVPSYMVLRSAGHWDGDELVKLAGQFSADRAGSVEWRLKNENIIVDKAMAKPLFGWGAWDWRVKDDEGNDITTSDGLWVIVLGRTGLVGLCSMALMLLLPIVMLITKIPARYWSHPLAAAPAALGVVVTVFAIDSLFNAMVNPLYVVVAGGLTAFIVTPMQAMRPMPMMMHRPVGPGQMSGVMQPQVRRIKGRPVQRRELIQRGMQP